MIIERHGPTEFFHRAVEANGVLYISGLTADDRSVSLKGQTEQVLSKLGRLLISLGSDKSKLLSATVYITEMAAKSEMNEAWKAFFAPGELPSRATIGVADLGERVLIEVVTVALR